MSEIKIGGVYFPNNYQNPEGVASNRAISDYLSPQSIEARNIPADSAKPADFREVQTVPSTESKGRVIDVRA